MSKNSLILLPKRVLFLQPKTPEIQALKEYLEQNSYEIIYWDNPNPYKLKEYLFQVRADIILVDIEMVRETMNCYDMVKAIEYYKSIGQVIFLTHEIDSGVLEVAKACNAVAYLLKPFRMYEVLVTLELVLDRIDKKIQKKHLDEYNLADSWKYCLKRKLLFKDDREVLLSKNGQSLISLLVKNRGCTVSFEQICYHIWNHDHSLGSLRSLVYRIHEQLNTHIIENIKGVGYRVKIFA